MKRFIRLCFMTVVLSIFALNIGQAQKPQQYVSGTIKANEVMIFLKDNVYVIDQELNIKGTLIIEPGTEIYQYDNGRIVVAAGGRLIADGLASATAKEPVSPKVLYPASTGGLEYADLRYFLYPFYEGNDPAATKTAGIANLSSRERTIHPLKYNHIFNVLLDVDNRRIVNIVDPNDWTTDNITAGPAGEFNSYSYTANAAGNLVVVPYETAIMFMAARMNLDPNLNPLLKTNPWTRGNGANVNVTPGKITFKGQPENNMSREWGHIVVMPGARAAFFRNCTFENFKKDTTVDRVAYYKDENRNELTVPTLSATELDELNKVILNMTNGGGGAITTFSSRTWLIGCEFNNNFARNRGGAVQILQSPTSYYYANMQVNSADTLGIPVYSNNKNLRVVDPNSDSTSVMARHKGYPQIDNIDSRNAEFFNNDAARVAWDDARLAGFLGRFRNLTFNSNMVRVAVTEPMQVDGKTIVQDNLDKSPEYPLPWGNMAYGGAVYVAGQPSEEYRQVEFGFGINDSINIDGYYINPNGKGEIDAITFSGNRAVNLQNSLNSNGAKGGAIYVGSNTSLIVAGAFEDNRAEAKFLVNEKTSYDNGTSYALGGAIYANNQSTGRLQVRGGKNRDEVVGGKVSNRNWTIFENNYAGAGGAIYVDNSADEIMSPVIGGSDSKAFNNEFGYRIVFKNNFAQAAGGAVFTRRNTRITGSGGRLSDYNYSPQDMVVFENNYAGFSGGALQIDIPNAQQNIARPHLRIANIIRAEFRNNVVGKDVISDLYREIRGGGAIYTLNADLNVVKAVKIAENKTYNGNGGGILAASPFSANKRMFLTDLDRVEYDADCYFDADGKRLPLGVEPVATNYTSVNAPFVYGENYPADVAASENIKEGIIATTRMLTIFDKNEANVIDSIADYQVTNFGATQMSKGYVMPVTDFNDQYWFDANTGLLAGTSGYLIKAFKENNKWKWENIDVGDGYSYNALCFTSPMTGFIGDNYGNIKKTTDGGATWKTVYSVNLSVESIRDIAFSGSSKGVAVTKNGNILVTSDGGENWVKYNYSQYVNNLVGAAWVTSSIGFVAGDKGLVLKTTDGGATWDVQTIPGVTDDLTKILFTSTTNGYVIGKNGAIASTVDGGNTWNVITGQIPTGVNLTAIHFYGQQYGYVATSNGEMYVTKDAGATWEALGIANGREILSIYFTNMNTGFITGNNAVVKKTTDGGLTWEVVIPADAASPLGGSPRLHANIPTMPENGIGLGGALFIVDEQKLDRIYRTDSLKFNRVRFTDNFAFSGSAIYSDNYDLKLVLNRSLVIGNKTDDRNDIGRHQNAINGPYNTNLAYNEQNLASSDLVAATIYGELQGPLPNSIFSTAANSIYGNDARFLIRLPDAPNTKGIMAGQNFLGSGGTDTLRGNYWGRTEANVILNVLHNISNHSGNGLAKSQFETFFVEYGDNNYLPFYHQQDGVDLRKQGPFEWNTTDYQEVRVTNKYHYTAINLDNQPNDVNAAADYTIPERYLFSGRVYDIYDKGTDIKTADYTRRRMVPIEDFAVGNPVFLKTYQDENDVRTAVEKKTKYVKRWKRNPEYANALLPNGNPEFPEIYAMQGLWKPMYSKETEGYTKADGTVVPPDNIPRYYHPLAMPLYLETQVNFDGEYVQSNWDYEHQAETVFFIINETTTDYIRVTLKQVPNRNDSSVWDNDLFRATVFFVPDSTNRSDGLARRNSENLLNLGSNGTFPFNSDPDAGAGGSASASLLQKLCPRNVSLDDAAHNEDFAALTGRKYITASTNSPRDYHLGGIADIYSNRRIDDNDKRVKKMPDDNIFDPAADNSYNAYFAGERFGTLPVNKGDVIRVVSRNVLWKEGVEKAYDGGLVFIITDGPEIPVFTGDIVMFGTDSLNPYMKGVDGSYPPIYNKIRPDLTGAIGDTAVYKTELLNKVFVQTDRNYPAYSGTYSNPTLPDNVRGTDSILTITAIDRNEFYDPRVEFWKDRYTDLTYTWSVGDNSGLKYWLMADTIKANNPPRDGARGYVVLKGLPINPYIVPGGEPVRVTAFNYPPGTLMIDSMRAAGLSDDIIKRYYQTFPKYFNTPFYYGANSDNPSSDTLARFLQQDTLGFGKDKFRAVADDIYIFVMDSLPRFIAYDVTGGAVPETFTIKEDFNKNTTIDVNYDWTKFQAGINSEGKIRANLTDRLRFKVDINTDDELQDATAEEKGWDFRYGRTAYSFANLANNGGEIVIVDTLTKKDGANIISQMKPAWMDNKYFMTYEDYTKDDPNLVDFQVRGQMNIRIDRDEALGLLKYDVLNSPDREVYNTDTVFGLVVNDGHGGLSTKLYDVYINFQPTIITESLPSATETVDYNPSLLDTVGARITVFDPNADQYHKFELLYPGVPVALNEGSDILYLDPFFKDEMTPIDLSTMKTTPTWLKIDEDSGILYGIPDLVTDLNNTKVTVTVLVKDEDGLFAIKQLELNVNTKNMPPSIAIAPMLDCLVSGQEIDEDVVVYDRDLLRDGDASKLETVTLSVEYPASLSITPSTITGPLTSDSVVVKLTSNGPFNFDPADVIDGRIDVAIKVVDKAGASQTLVFKIRVSDDVDFLSNITVINARNSSKTLSWGTARNATTGDGLDGQAVGRLDENYCEIEIPHIPPQDVFDARWSITYTNGTYRNIFPSAKAGSNQTLHRYKGIFQPGGETGQTSAFYPITLRWDPSTVPAIDASNNPQGSTWRLIDGGTNGNYFSINMHNVASRNISSVAQFRENSDGTVEIIITDPRITSFHITHDWYSGVNDAENGIVATSLNAISPNPAGINQDKVNISFDVEKAGNVYIEVFNELGEKVATVVDDYFNAGHYDVAFTLRDLKGTKLSSGAYSVRLTSGMTTSTKQLIVLN